MAATRDVARNVEIVAANSVNGPRLIVCDLAGTTIHDGGQVVEAFTVALSEAGLRVSPAELNQVRGSSKRQAISRFIAAGPDHAERSTATYERFRDLLAERYRRDGVRPVEGAAATFQWLRAEGIKVALNTGFERDITSLLLRALTWHTDTVDAIVCGDDVARGRPAPDLILQAMKATGTTNPLEVMNVGDTILDLQAGQQAGVRWNVGVLSGAHLREQLEQAPHTDIVASIADLPVLIGGRAAERQAGGTP